MDEWVWSNGGMIVTGEKWSFERKTLYSVGGRWMNEYGAMVEWYLQGKTEILGEKHYTAWVVNGWMSMEQWGNDTDRGKLKYWEKNIIHCGWYMDGWLWNNGGMILTKGSEVLGEKYYTAWVLDEWMSMQQWWNDTDRGKLNYWDRNIIQRRW